MTFLVLGTGGFLFWVSGEAANQLLTPRRSEQDSYHRAVAMEPEKYGFTIDNISVAREEGVAIQAQYVRPLKNDGQLRRRTFSKVLREVGQEDLLRWQQPRGTIVLLHGRNSIKEHWYPVAEKFCAVGYNLILLDSRGHGCTVGGYCTFGSKEADDVKAVLSMIEQRWGNQQPLGIIGYSLGGAIAAHTASSNPEFKAVALISVFSSLPEVSRHVGHKRYGSWVKVLLPSLRARVKWTADFDLDDIAPVHDAGKITIPTLVVHGEQDQYIPMAHGRKVYDALAASTKQWCPVPTAAHANVFVMGGDPLIAKMLVFFSQHLRH